MSYGLWVLATVAVGLIREPDGTYRCPYADPDIDGPGTPCPFPFDPLLLHGQPIGQYHCPYCGSMVLAGLPHPDYREDDEP